MRPSVADWVGCRTCGPSVVDRSPSGRKNPSALTPAHILRNSVAPTLDSRLAHYDVTALIGEGGMGQVYRATDTKLNRPVALKILPEAFAEDPDRLARFQREAQVLASLNHPNIAAIHGLEESEGIKALVLEYIERPTLADRIARGPITAPRAKRGDLFAALRTGLQHRLCLCLRRLVQRRNTKMRTLLAHVSSSQSNAIRARLLTVLLVIALVAPLILIAPGTATAQAPAQGTYAFTDVNVIPMDAERVLSDQTVVVESGRIAAVGAAASTSVPVGATRIDGRGKYLLPGLSEMHGHVPRSNENAEAEDVLFLYVAAGGTTVRGMQGHPSQIELRRRVRDGEIVGPRLWLAAPALRGNNVQDAATAERLVRQAKAQGFDLLKVQEGLTAEAYTAIVRVAKEVDLPWGGHVSVNVGVPGALAVKQSTIDHLDDYLEAMQPTDSPALRASGPERSRLLALHADESKIPELARATREAGVAVVPTQILWEVLRGKRDPATLMNRPENRYMPRETVETWMRRTTNTYTNASREVAAREAEVRQRLLKAMSDEGVLILMGTDAPQVFSVPGFSLHRELPLMVESGMTPYEVLRTGTVNVAQHFNIEDRAGTVAVGKNADLLLLEANPFEDIHAVENNAGVMVDGRWLAPEFIRARLEAIAAKHGG